MRRYVILFLLVLMPLQLSWAAVGSYCDHESGQQAQHLGHHPHQHTEGKGAADNKPGNIKQPGGTHADCSVCHAGAAIASVDESSTPGSSAGAKSISWCSDHAPSALKDRPERPKWLALA